MRHVVSRLLLLFIARTHGRWPGTKSAKLARPHHHHRFWQAPLRVRSAERRHQSPEWTVLRQVNCVVHIEVAGFQILLNGFHPRGRPSGLVQFLAGEAVKICFTSIS